MCRFLAYHGDPVYLDELVCAPTHSLVHQSEGAGADLPGKAAQVLVGPGRPHIAVQAGLGPLAVPATATPSPMAAICSCITARSAATRASAGGSRRWSRRICRERLRRFSSDQAGRTSRYRPGSGRSPYQPMPSRFLAYHGDPVYLDELVCAPTHSLVHQSLHATEAAFMER
jgi:hypothetical protein